MQADLLSSLQAREAVLRGGAGGAARHHLSKAGNAASSIVRVTLRADIVKLLCDTL